MLACLLAASAATVLLGPSAVEFFGRKDPGPMVLDEVAGICLTMLAQPLAQSSRIILLVILGFIFFRIFDVLKPPPCRQLERLAAGWGILMDDLMAAVYANIACQIFLRLL
jgi:phosphatidylglycerophosphatase A